MKRIYKSSCECIPNLTFTTTLFSFIFSLIIINTAIFLNSHITHFILSL